MRSPWLAILLLAALAVPAVPAAAPVRDHVPDVDDYFTIRNINEIAVSPDGGRVAYVEQRWQGPDERRRTDLWLVAVDGGARTRLSFDHSGTHGLVWAPDGRHLYLAARADGGEDAPPRDGSSQGLRVDVAAGLWTPVTAVDDGVGDFLLAPDGGTLYYTVTEEELDEEWADLRGAWDMLDYGHGVRDLDAVRAIDLESWRDREVLAAGRVIREMALSTDGGRLAMIVTDDNELIFKEGWSRVEVLDLDSGSIDVATPEGWRDAHPSPFGWLDDLAWAADGGALAFAVSFDGFATEIFVVDWPADARLTRLERPDPWSYEGGLCWRGDGRTLSYIAGDRARQRAVAVRDVRDGRQGRSDDLTPGDVYVEALDYSADGKALAVVMGSPTALPDIAVIDGRGRARRLTDLNPQAASWILPRIEIVRWTGEDGVPIEGVLETPAGWTAADGPLPTVIELHGGPTSHTGYNLRFWIYGRTLLAGKGYALLSPNYRGSTTFGDAFTAQLVGRENDIEVADILAGVRAMIDRGVADPDRLGVMGWSNGGYLTNCLITAAPTMFKAASSGAGMLDQILQWGQQDTPGHNINYMQGLPWENPDAYHAASPIYGLGEVTTPTLIHQGGDDDRITPGNSYTLYRSLRHYLKVPVELIVYPGEGHSLTVYDHRKAKMEWDLAWFEKYLLGEEGGE